MYTTVEAHLDDGAVTTKDLHMLPKHALVLLTVLREEGDGHSTQPSLAEVVEKSAGVMHQELDAVKWQRETRSEWHA